MTDSEYWLPDQLHTELVSRESSAMNVRLCVRMQEDLTKEESSMRTARQRLQSRKHSTAEICSEQ
jgi:hypothetical protein